MQTVIIVIHLMIVIAMIAVILLQRSEGGALGIGGGGGGMFTARGSANLLTRTTTILAIAFFVTSLGLGLLAKQQSGAPSILDGAGVSGPATPAGDDASRGTGSGILDTLRATSGDEAPAEDLAPPTGDDTTPSAPAGTTDTPATPPAPQSGTPAVPTGQ